MQTSKTGVKELQTGGRTKYYKNTQTLMPGGGGVLLEPLYTLILTVLRNNVFCCANCAAKIYD